MNNYPENGEKNTEQENSGQRLTDSKVQTVNQTNTITDTKTCQHATLHIIHTEHNTL